MRKGLLSTLIFVGISLGISACSHVDIDFADRSPASIAPEKFAKACENMSADDLKTFRALYKSNAGINGAMTELTKLAHVLEIDKTVYDQNRLTVQFFFSKDPTWVFNSLETFGSILLGDCYLTRDGMDVSDTVSKVREPKKFAQVEKLCGPADSKVLPQYRAHPDALRSWDPASHEGDVALRAWVADINKLQNPTTGEILAPDKILELCTNFKSRENIEDLLENLFICVDAFTLSLQDYNYTTGKYEKLKPQSNSLKGCLKGLNEDKIEVTSDGTPAGPKRDYTKSNNSSATQGRAGSGQGSGAANGSGSSGASGGAQVTPNGNPLSASTDGKSTGGAFTTHGTSKSSEQSVTLPGDRKGEAISIQDACLKDFIGDSQKNLALFFSPSMANKFTELSSKNLVKLYTDDEREKLIYAISKQQATVLGQAYVIQAMQQNWDTPKAFDDYLKKFVNSCSHGRLKDELAVMMQKEYLDKKSSEPDPTPKDPLDYFKSLINGTAPPQAPEPEYYDAGFADQKDFVSTVGQRMVSAVDRIEAVRDLIYLLNVEIGAKEFTTTNIPKVPDWFPSHVIKKIGGAPIFAGFGEGYKYQCNGLSMVSDSIVDLDANLLTASDAQIRRFIGAEVFRKRAFCTHQDGSGECNYPEEFEAYLRATDRANLTGEHRIRLTEWCSIRFHAAQSLKQIEAQLITLNPVLAHAELIDPAKPVTKDNIGPTFLDRLMQMKATTAEKVKLAAKEAERIMPGLQFDILKSLKRTCDDLDSSEPQTVYMNVLSQDFLSGFDYCATLPSEQQTKLGLTCKERIPFLSCKLKAEAEAWEFHKDRFQMYMEVGLIGLDALFVESIMSGGILRGLTVKGAINSGLTGASFALGNYALTSWLTSNNEALWDDYHRGLAGSALNGVDSYTNAIVALASAHPQLQTKDFIIGFVLGAAMSGGPKEAGIAAKRVAARFKMQSRSTPVEVFNEVAKKIGDYAERTEKGGVRFEPKNIAELKNWMMKQAAEHPDFPSQLAKNLGEHLKDLSEGDYANLFRNTEGKTALGLVRRAIQVRFKEVSRGFGKVFNDLKSKIATKKFKGEKLSETEANINSVDLKSVDLASMGDELGPREIADISDAAEEASKDVPGEAPASKANRVSEFLGKLCGVSLTCPSMKGIVGCKK